MYKIKVTTNFSAAHSLSGYKGDCCNLHGHNWKVMVTINCEKQDSIGMAIDFRKAKQLLNSVIAEFDHTYLNDLPCFSDTNPTSEELARCIYLKLKDQFAAINGRLIETEVWESDNSSVVYYES